jgi:hypothetical protein
MTVRKIYLSEILSMRPPATSRMGNVPFNLANRFAARCGRKRNSVNLGAADMASGALTPDEAQAITGVIANHISCTKP